MNKLDAGTLPTEQLKRFSLQRSSLKGLIESCLEWLLVFTLSAIPFVLFYTTRLKSSFDHISILLLIIWFILLRGRTGNPLPRYLIIVALFYAASFLISSTISDNGPFLVTEIDCLRIPVLAALIYAMPFRPLTRKIIITILLAIAASMGVIAALQYFGLFFQQMERPSGYLLNMSAAYAGMLSFASGASIIMLILRENNPFRTIYERIYLYIVLICTLAGIVFFQSRGTWLAFIISIVATMVLIDRRKAIITVIALFLGISIILYSNIQLRHRAVSIITSPYTENETGSAGERIELWKAALIIFQRAPIIGTGVWDFQRDAQQLIEEGKIKNVPTIIHAHSTYLHNLATRGIVGFVTTVALLAALLVWGLSMVNKRSGIGSYVVVFCTLVMILSGMTEVSFADGAPYVFAYWYIIGLFGPIKKERYESKTD